MHRALALVLALVLVGGTRAGDKKALTAERVGQLLTILRSDLNEDNRAHAAEELGRADGNQYPEVVVLLIEALKSDPKPSVRAEVVDSLAKIRPVTREAGKALDAAKEDGSFKVRWHVRTAVRVYHTAGYQEQDKKIASSPGKSTLATPRVPSESAVSPPAQRSNGWLANLINKPAAAPAPEQATPKPQPPVVIAETPQEGGLIHQILSRSKSASGNGVTGKEPPLSQPPEVSAPRSYAVPPTQNGSGNPYADIPSAPATPAVQPKPSPYAPQQPVIPVIPGKQGTDG
jgi:hypothetical protein